MKQTILFFVLVLTSCWQQSGKPNVNELEQSNLVQNEQVVESSKVLNTIESRIRVPSGFERAQFDDHSFPFYLRNLRLKPEGSKVHMFHGGEKPNKEVYAAVIDLGIGKKDLHQCADAVMRLRGEYLWEQGRYDEIHFNFTNGFRVDYSEWMKGRRMVVDGNQTYWNDRSAPSNTYDDFWKYMELIFTYAGTASLEKEMEQIPVADAQSGDVLIQGGYPGHAVIIVDEAKNTQTGEKIFLLAQSYMPAQDLQLLVNPNDKNMSPWYRLKNGIIKTPEWIFTDEHLRRF